MNPQAVGKDCTDIVLSELSVVLDTPLSCLDLKSNFVGNGGDSLLSIRLQIALRKHGIYIPIHSIFNAGTLLFLAQSWALESCRDVLPLASSRRAVNQERSSIVEIPPKNRLRTSIREARDSTSYPMTEMQLSLVYSTQTTPGRNIILYIETHLPKNVSALKQAWKRALKAEPIFNMSFVVDESGGYMYESREQPFVWKESVFEDKLSYQAYRREVESQALSSSSIATSFTVITFQPPGIEGESIIIWQVHHAMIDGISYELVRSNVQRLLTGKQIQTGSSFTDFVSKLEEFQQQEHESAINFWARQKKDHPDPVMELQLPIPLSDDTDRGTGLCHVYVESNINELAMYCKSIGVTVASLYYAAWGLVLSKYTGSDHICFGAVLSGRSLPFDEMQSVVGPTINTLPLNVSLGTCSTLMQYIHLVFSSLLDLNSFQWTEPSHGFSRNFLSAVSIRFDTLDLAGGSYEPLEQPYSRTVSDFPLHVEVRKSGRISLTYDSTSFSKAHIHHLGSVLSTALNALLSPTLTVSSCLSFLVGSEQLKYLALMGNWTSETTRGGSIKDDLVSVFTRSAEMDLDAIAIEQGARIMKYGELHTQSSIISQHLSHFVRPGDVVCVHADGTLNWIVAIYSVLKAGAVYCPFDPDIPDPIKSENFMTANAKLFLVGNIAAKSAKPSSCKLSLSVEEILQDTTVPANPRSGEACPESIAYICFTSGSTGKPKGVMCRHRGLVAFQKDFRVRLCARPGWRIAQFMSPGFDGSIHEIFSALSYGSTLVLKDISNPFDHLKRCDAAILTPSVAKVLEVDEFPNLKAVYLVGEAVPQTVCDTWAVRKQLFNMYGPTEATCGATIKILTANESVTIGAPNPSTRIYILDYDIKLVPPGVIGEIYLAGVQVAAGYVGRPDESSRKFLPDSVNPEYSGEYMYKTGDRAFWNEQGELVFVGRIDRQIKLRGFRIDLDDLEIRMAKADEQCTAAALSVQNDQLIALFQPANLDLNKLKSRIRQYVPPYAMPHCMRAVDTFPMTPIGKLDYKAISTMANLDPNQDKSMIVSMQKVTAAMKNALHLPKDCNVNPESRFRDLGGNSLTALLLSHHLSGIFHQRIPVSMILSSSTVRELAEAMSSRQVSDDNHMGPPLGDYRLSSIEKEWWHKYQWGNTSSFNVSYACELPVYYNKTGLIAAWNLVLARHRILRSRYRYYERGLVREFAQHSPTIKQTELIDIHHEINAPFDLATDDLVRVTISSKHMLVVISHIICDFTTLKILLGEVADVYRQRELKPAPKTYFEISRPTSSVLYHQLFWSQYLDTASTPHLSIGNISVRRRSWSGLTSIWQIPKNTYQAMLYFARENKVTMHQLATAAVALALQHDTGTSDITIGAPYLNRNSKEDLEVIGLFLEPLPIRIRYPPPEENRMGYEASNSRPDMNQKTFIKAVQRSCRAALSHAMPWSQLLSHLNIEADFPNHPIFDVMVTFHEDDPEIYLPLQGGQFLPSWSNGSKFKIMVEFTAMRDENLTMRLEYSDECFTREDAQLIGQLVPEALEGLVLGHNYNRITRKLKSLKDGFYSRSTKLID
ncbi:hypothetical protein M426DRAFT_262558 [Hypoxylon sp. CI-4A]|nr:hypothetical protein M426DRAFT_262558 [Hypoxylon sp. CI-4A]